VLIAPLPPAPLHKCMADTTLLNRYHHSKYLYHIPFHRQLARFSNLGVRISSSTVGDWFSQSCELLKPLYDLLRRRVLSSDYIQVDESTTSCDKTMRSSELSKGYVWASSQSGYSRGVLSLRQRIAFRTNGRCCCCMILKGLFRQTVINVYQKLEQLEGITDAGLLGTCTTIIWWIIG